MLRVLQMQNTMTLTSNFYREEMFSTLSLKGAYWAQKGLWYPINTGRITVDRRDPKTVTSYHPVWVRWCRWCVWNAILPVPWTRKARLMWKPTLTVPPSSFPMNGGFCCQLQEQKHLYQQLRNTTQLSRYTGLPAQVQDTTGSTNGKIPEVHVH